MFETYYLNDLYFGKIKKYINPSISIEKEYVSIGCDKTSEYMAIVYIGDDGIFDIDHPSKLINIKTDDKNVKPIVNKEDNNLYELDLDSLTKVTSKLMGDNVTKLKRVPFKKYKFLK